MPLRRLLTRSVVALLCALPLLPRPAAAAPVAPPEGPMRVYHLGHSLVGRDMPAMLAQLAGPGHGYESQLGWGTSLREHWEPGLTIRGFDAENDHPNFRPAREAVGSGDYDAVIFTEMVEIRDAIRYHASAAYLARWAALAARARGDVRVYLLETWHKLDDPEGWLNRIDRDLGRYWLRRIALPAQRKAGVPIHLVPAGQVLARLTRRIEAVGGVAGLPDRTALFARRPDGSTDPIHLGDLGNYLLALTHYAVLYQRSPVGLPRRLARADGTPATPPSPQAARIMQETVWEVVSSMPETGVSP